MNALNAMKTAELVGLGSKEALAELERRIAKKAADGKHPVTSTIEAYNALAAKHGGKAMEVPEFKSKSFLATATPTQIADRIKGRSDIGEVITALTKVMA